MRAEWPAGSTTSSLNFELSLFESERSSSGTLRFEITDGRRRISQEPSRHMVMMKLSYLMRLRCMGRLISMTRTSK